MFDHASPWLAELNDRQRRAVVSDARSLLVIAGAGSGKTKTLASRVAHVIASGTPPGRVLLLTFTRRAAREMVGRSERLVGTRGPGRVWGGTFHSIANRLLRMHGNAVGIPASFTVIDQTDTSDLLDLVRSDLGLDKRERRFPQKATLAAIYSCAVNSGAKLADVLEKRFPWCASDFDDIAELFRLYVERKKEQFCLDYDDLLLYWDALLRAPATKKVVSGSFDHILVDEYQDTNRLQASILRGMRDGANSLMVVGDDAQSIYSFRAATVRNILDFPSEHPGAEIVTLEQNYRSTQPILEASNAVIAQARERFSKSMWSSVSSEQKPRLVTCVDELEQANEVCRSVLERRERGVALREQAVLFRTGHHSDLLELELTRRRIPFVKYGGLRFLEAAHIKDVLALLRILENPHDELAWFRVLQLLDGVGPATARRVLDHLGVRRSAHDAATRSPLDRLTRDPPPVPAAARSDFQALASTLAECLGSGLGPRGDLERLRQLYDPIAARRHARADARIRDLDQLAEVAAGYRTRERFLSELILDPPNSTGDYAGPPLLDNDYLVLSTIHSAKGGEWHAVHVIHAADGSIPSDMATGNDAEIDEELRLFYVALTRARRELDVYFPLRYYHQRNGLADAHSYAQLTRFLPAPVRGLFEAVSPTGPPPDDPPHVSSETASVDAYLAGLWSR